MKTHRISPRLSIGALAFLAMALICIAGTGLIYAAGLLPIPAPPLAWTQPAASASPAGTPALPGPASATLPARPTTGVDLPAVEAAQCVPRNTTRSLATVTRVVDGDTIAVSIDGQPYTVRYIGVDTPESTRTVEYYGEQASVKNRELVEGKTVLLVKDVSETDRFGRLLRYVFAGEVFVNYALASQGYATAVTFPPDVACKETFQAAQAEAERSGAGLWAATPVPTPPATGESGGQREGCSPAYPGVCIPPPPPDLDCGDIPDNRFQVLPPDPHNFDLDRNGVGCE